MLIYNTWWDLRAFQFLQEVLLLNLCKQDLEYSQNIQFGDPHQKIKKLIRGLCNFINASYF